MAKVNYFSISTIILALVGFIFSMVFQRMAYMGKDGAITMQWYWLGALLSYGLCLISIRTMFLKTNDNHYSGLDYVLRAISLILIIASFMWTTFIIMAWHSGF